MMTVSIQPRKKPARRPRTMPLVSAMVTTTTPMKSEKRAP